MSTLNREQLNFKIIESIQECGWAVLYTSPLDSAPFSITIYNNDESHRLRIYIRNLTHGGGLRNQDEFRIQVNFDRSPGFKFICEDGVKTLVLGWWDEAGMFAGFDVRKHSGVLKYSSSIQIVKNTLINATYNNVATQEKTNEEVAVAFTPDFFIEYVRNIEGFHNLGTSTNDLQTVEKIIKKISETPQESITPEIEQISESRQSVVRTITQKVRDSAFRKRVLTAYGHRCAFCSVQLKLVDAAHILPVADQESSDVTSNGLSLCALHHRAYDSGLITITESFEVKINERKMNQLNEMSLGGGSSEFRTNLRAIIHLPPEISQRPHSYFISKANSRRGWNGL